jgi:hypothetical protein
MEIIGLSGLDPESNICHIKVTEELMVSDCISGHCAPGFVVSTLRPRTCYAELIRVASNGVRFLGTLGFPRLLL